MSAPLQEPATLGPLPSQAERAVRIRALLQRWQNEAQVQTLDDEPDWDLDDIWYLRRRPAEPATLPQRPAIHHGPPMAAASNGSAKSPSDPIK